MTADQSIAFSTGLIAKLRHEQLIRYDALKGRFEDLYQQIRHGDSSRFVTPWWSYIIAELEQAFLPYPSADFLRNELITYTMVAAYQQETIAEWLASVERVADSEQLMAVLCEDPIGDPVLHVPKYYTSCNSVLHMFYVALYASVTETNFQPIRTVVEWGGGYGNLSKIMQRMVGRPLTYVIVDLPIISALQWFYLSCVFGDERVHLITSPDDTIRQECFNLLPTHLLDAYDPQADIFVSTFALSECSAEAQDYVVGRSWFGAKKLLITYSESNEMVPNSGRLGTIAREYGATVSRFGHILDKTTLWSAFR